MNFKSLLSSFFIFMTITTVFSQTTWEMQLDVAGEDKFTDATLTMDGAYVLTAAINDQQTLFENQEFSLVKLDSLGETVWIKNLLEPAKGKAWSVIETNEGDFIIGGEINEEGINEFDFPTPIIIKTDENGEEIWRQLVQTEDFDLYELIKVINTEDNGFLVYGKAYSDTSGYFPPAIIKYNQAGEKEWQQVYLSAEKDRPARYSGIVEISNLAYVFITQDFVNPDNSPVYFDMYLYRVDLSGNLIWRTHFTDESEDIIYFTPKEVLVNEEEEIIYFNSEKRTQGEQYIRPYIAKLNYAGDVLWELEVPKEITGGSNNYHSSGFCFTDDGELMVLGHWTTDFSFSVLSADDGSLISQRLSDDLVPNFKFAFGIINTPDDGYFVFGTLNGIDANGFDDFYSFKTNAQGSLTTEVTDEIILSSEIELYPNPTTDRLFFSSDIISNETNVQIFDSYGRLILQTQIDIANHESVDISSLSKGLYFINIDLEEGSSWRQKFVKE